MCRKQRKACFAVSAWVTPSTASLLSCSATQRVLLQSNYSPVADETRTRIFRCPAFRCYKSVQPHLWAPSPYGHFAEHASATARVSACVLSAAHCTPHQGCRVSRKATESRGCYPELLAFLSHSSSCAVNQIFSYVEEAQQPGNS